MAAARKPKSARPSGTNRSLSRYQSMRDFGVTAEPRGAKSKSQLASATRSLPFVVQKHAATRLHYDFRLGLDGVLKSWAVTKGPSYYPGDKRLAVQVEDHPWEYAGFEGTIPKGQYGGGTVMVWDEGEWIPHGDAEQGLKDGELKFELHGKKLKGNWVLVRMHGPAGGSGKTNWLLIKERDKFARDSSAPPSSMKHRIARSVAGRWTRSRRAMTAYGILRAERIMAKRQLHIKRNRNRCPFRLRVRRNTRRPSRTLVVFQRSDFPASLLPSWRSRQILPRKAMTGCMS